MTPDFLPYNNMLINPLGLLRSGSQAACLQEVVAADLTRGRHRAAGVWASWEGLSDLGVCQERRERQDSPRTDRPLQSAAPGQGTGRGSCSIY